MSNSNPRMLLSKRFTGAFALLALVALSVAACGGSSGTAPAEPGAEAASASAASEPPPPAAPAVPAPPVEPEPEPVEPAPSRAQRVTSADGLLTIEVPEGATADVSTQISARALGPDELPAELAAFELRGTVHELGPDGSTFDVPVTVTRRVDTDALGVDLDDGVPVIALASLSSDGTWDVLADQSISLDGTTAIVSGTTTHFTTIVAFGGAAQVSMRPDNIKRKEDRSWTSRVLVVATQDAAADFRPSIANVESFVGSTGALTAGKTLIDAKTERGKARFTCEKVGRDDFSVTVLLSNSLAFLELIGLDEAAGIASSTTVTLDGKARCNAATPAPADPVTDPEDPLADPSDPLAELDAPDSSEASPAGVPANCGIIFMPFENTSNELVGEFTCSVPVQTIVLDPLDPPDEIIQCFSPGGSCEHQGDGSWTFNVPDSDSGMIFFRFDDDAPQGAMLSGSFVPSNGFESGDDSSWRSTTP